jgi:hypothetical protein
MNIVGTELLVCGCLLGAVLVGVRLRRLLPDHHLSSDSRDAVKLAMGLVATMTALVLGLLISSAKSSFDTERNEVVQMAAKIVFLDRILALYGPDASGVRALFREAVAESVHRMWPDDARAPIRPGTDQRTGNAIYEAIQNLSPHDETQRSLKIQATDLAIELGQLQALLAAQSVSSISKPLLAMMLCWLVVIFLGFSLLAPPNATTTVALIASVLSVTGAVFLILQLDQPMTGLIRISSQPIVNALNQFSK